MSQATLLENRIIPMGDIHRHPKNYRKHSQEEIQQLMASLMRFGQARSICVQEDPSGGYTVVAGEKTWKAAKYLGWDEMKADVFPAKTSETEIHAYIVADNRLQGRDADEEMLLLLLQEQEKAGFTLDMIGSSEQELADLQKKFQKENEQEAALLWSAPETITTTTPSQFQISSDPATGVNVPLLNPTQIVTASQPVQETLGLTFTPRVIADVPAVGSREAPAEKIANFEQSLVRQIVLIFTQDEYTWMMQRIRQAKEAFGGLDTNTDVIVHLLKYWIEKEAIPDIEWPDPFQEKTHA